MEKLADGLYNKIFNLTIGNGKLVVARIPNPNVGPDFLTTASEVATMDLVSVLTTNTLLIYTYIYFRFAYELTWF